MNLIRSYETMNNKGVGAVFCLISAILISVKYISASIIMSGVASWDSGLFEAGLSNVGSFLSTASLISLIVGVLFIGYGLYQDIKENNKK